MRELTGTELIQDLKNKLATEMQTTERLKRELAIEREVSIYQWGQLKPGVKVSLNELATIKLVVRGLTNQAIADELCVAEKTIRCRLTKIYRKIGVSNRLLLVKMWLGTGNRVL